MGWSTPAIGIEIDQLPILPPGQAHSPITGPITLTGLGIYRTLFVVHSWTGPASATVYGGMNLSTLNNAFQIDNQQVYLQAANWASDTSSIRGGGTAKTVFPLNGATEALLTPFGSLAGYSYTVYGTTEALDFMHDQFPLVSTADTEMLIVNAYTINNAGSTFPIPCTAHPSRAYIEIPSGSANGYTVRAMDTVDAVQLFYLTPGRGAMVGMENYYNGSTSALQVNTSRPYIDFPNTLRPMTLQTPSSLSGTNELNVYWHRSIQD